MKCDILINKSMLVPPVQKKKGKGHTLYLSQEAVKYFFLSFTSLTNIQV